MGDLKARLKATFLRRNSSTTSAASSKSRNSDGRSTHKDDHEGSRRPPASSGSAQPRSVKTEYASSSIHTTGEEEERGRVDQRTWTHDQEQHPHGRHTQQRPLSTASSNALATSDPDLNRNLNNQAAPADPGAGGTDLDTATTLRSGTVIGNGAPEGSDLQPAMPTSRSNSSTASNISPDTTFPPQAAFLPSIREHNDSASISGAETSATSRHLPPIVTSAPVTVRSLPRALYDNDETHLAEPGSAEAGTPTPTAAGPSLLPSPLASAIEGPGVARRQSILPKRQTKLIRALLDSGHAHDLELADSDQLVPISGTMVTRKIWVKRPGASPTLITINEDDLVDDVRDMILRKYANSLGRSFDAPDLTIRICPREQNPRHMQPDEPMGRTLDASFPGGQTVDDALLIDVPTRRTPKASPNPRFYDDRPHESGSDYFPPYPPQIHTHHAAGLPPATAIPNMSHSNLHFPPAMSVIGNGQLPPLPSPGGTRRSRPKIMRMHTASPVSTGTNGIVQHAPVPGQAAIGTHTYTQRPVARSRTHSGASSDHSAHPNHQPPSAPPLPSPPAQDRAATPPPRVASPRLSTRPKKIKKNIEPPSLPSGLLNGGVPPINVLIVEDNIINLRLLEAFVKRLKVRWASAMNGREAVNKWRAGGFHLVLMDIQLPVMNGLEATREIRRIERVNNIGVFSSGAIAAPQEVKPEPEEQDRLENTEMFKSPVIIVALTASSLQSDRHEALAAGCNDFLTKVSQTQPLHFLAGCTNISASL